MSKCGCRLEGLCGRRRQVVRKHRESGWRLDTVEDGEATCWVQDESHRKSVTGGLGLDESETTDGSCELECGLRRGARGTGEIRRSVMARAVVMAGTV